MNRKIMFFDIDGTILTPDTHVIPESTKEAIKKARSAGNLAFINTGRTYFNVEKEIRDIGFDGYVCGCGTFVMADGKVIVSKTLSPESCKAIIEHLRRYKVDAVLEGLEDVYFDSSEPYTEEFRNLKAVFQKRGHGIRKNWDTNGLTFDKFFTKISMETNVSEFRKFFEQDYDFIDRGEGVGEITPKGYSKASGIKKVLEYYGLTVNDAYVFGDSSNDLPMFEYIPNSIAMGESDECIYQKAGFITKDIHEDGIAYAIEHFKLGND